MPRSLQVFQQLTGTAHYHLGYFDGGSRDLDHALDRLALLDTEHCDRDAPVLDAGCGMGGTAALLARLGFHVVGVDPAHDSIRFASERCAAGARVRYVTSRLEDYVPANASGFGSIVMIEVTQHFECLGQALMLAGRALRQGGRILLKDVFTGRRHPRERVPYHVREDVEAAVVRAGLDVVCRRDISANVVDTLPLLRARIERCWPAAAALRADLGELDACLGALAAAFSAGEIAYESLLLTKSECA